MLIILGTNSCQEESNNSGLFVKPHLFLGGNTYQDTMGTQNTTATSKNLSRLLTFFQVQTTFLELSQQLRQQRIIGITELDVHSIVIAEMMF